MIDYVLVSNVKEIRLEAELSDGQGRLIASLYEDESGWQLNRFEKDAIPEKLLAQLKSNMQAYVNRKGTAAPEGMNRGEMALWLMLKADGTAMGLPYEA